MSAKIVNNQKDSSQIRKKKFQKLRNLFEVLHFKNNLASSRTKNDSPLYS